MDYCENPSLSYFLCVIALLGFVCVLLSIKRFSLFHECNRQRDKARERQSSTKLNAGVSDLRSRRDPSRDSLQLYKELYMKLHQLENNFEILPQCRGILDSILSETISDHDRCIFDSINSVAYYTPGRLHDFLRHEDDKVMQAWADYIQRRREGKPREMFSDHKSAILWLKQVSPLKYVDGSWLGHIHKACTPYPLRHITRYAWQILSDELGGGVRDRNHAYVYRQLMKSVDADLPSPPDPDFAHPRHGLDNSSIWHAAVVQLLISLFPNDLLPEILGFNMHFEKITAETMIVARELKELHIDPYYFILHISIDNAHSGHTALAKSVVLKYLEYIKVSQGPDCLQKTWRRVQSGYQLSQNLSGHNSQSSRSTFFDIGSHTSQSLDDELLALFHRKTLAAGTIHCSSRLMLGEKSLVHWLRPETFQSGSEQREFINALVNTKPWICKGSSTKSKLFQEMLWGGKMFGAFTTSELDIVRKWIDSLKNPNEQRKEDFSGHSEPRYEERDLISLKQVKTNDLSEPADQTQETANADSGNYKRRNTVTSFGRPILAKFLPIWFSHVCLLEGFVTVPAITMADHMSSAVPILRAQYGLEEENEVVAGTDSLLDIQSNDVISIGIEMAMNGRQVQVSCLEDVLHLWPSEFARKMLEFSRKPQKNASFLFGLSAAFIELHCNLAASETAFLSATSRALLARMARREEHALACYVEHIKLSQGEPAFQAGFELGSSQIEACFEEYI